MTNRERWIRTLKCEKIGGQVPTFELVFFLTMEAFGKLHFSQRRFDQWKQMSRTEQKLHIDDMARLYIQTAERSGHSAIFVQPNEFPDPDHLEVTQELLERIRELSGDEYFLMLHGDPTWAIPDGAHMMGFSVRMYEDPEGLNEESKQRLDSVLRAAAKLDQAGHLLDGFGLCSDYCLNANPFFTQEQFEELIQPTLSAVIREFRAMGYYSIKHTDGNIMPILRQIADCKPDAIHSLDPQPAESQGDCWRIRLPHRKRQLRPSANRYGRGVRRGRPALPARGNGRRKGLYLFHIELRLYGNASGAVRTHD